MLGPLDIHQFLLAHDVRHEIVRLPRTAPGATSLAEALRLPAHQCVAVHPFHTTTSDGDLLAVILAPSDADADPVTMADQLASLLRGRLSEPLHFVPANAALISRHTDYLAGHVSPLLLPQSVAVVATQALADLATATVYTATGDAGTALALRALDLLVLSHAIVLPESQRVARRRPITIDLTPGRGARLDPAPRRNEATRPQPLTNRANSNPQVAGKAAS
jgi:prolyl-tRNA editing enzyme YbaK/EbsC (Cys-tRNA(Pro) deacylase)